MTEGRNGKNWKLNSNQTEIRYDLSTSKLQTLESRATSRLNYFTSKFRRIHKWIEDEKINGVRINSSVSDEFYTAKERKAFWTYRLEQIHLILTERILLEENIDSK